MTAPIARIVEGLRHIERNFRPAALVRGKVVAREAEAKFLIEMVTDAADLIESLDWSEIER